SVEKQGREGEAEAHYREALGIEPGSFQARFNLGSLYWAQARWPEAAAMFEAASKIRPEDQKARRFADRARRRADGVR
ncbi:MAG: tetratricopeptide repeat protein, partial [Elusimicrobiota bacterium]